jgi:hypothetical protein
MLNQEIFHSLYVDDDHSLREPFGQLHAVQQARRITDATVPEPRTDPQPQNAYWAASEQGGGPVGYQRHPGSYYAALFRPRVLVRPPTWTTRPARSGCHVATNRQHGPTATVGERAGSCSEAGSGCGGYRVVRQVRSRFCILLRSCV